MSYVKDICNIFSMNKDGPEVGIYMDRNEDIFYDKDEDYATRCLGFIGMHGDLSSLMATVRNAQAQGFLFG